MQEALIDGILYRRDIVSLTGRRRHGKTTVLHNIALAGEFKPEYLGFPISRPFRTLAFYLEDDPGDLHEKLKVMLDGKFSKDIHLCTRANFFNWDIPIGLNKAFTAKVQECCQAAQPDLIMFDNLGMVVDGKYNESETIHSLMKLAWKLTQNYNAALIIAAHPRKENKLERVSLKDAPDNFFEECMGSSHFINSTGAMWGIERNLDTNVTHLLLGSQRHTGTHQFTLVEKNDQHWFERINDVSIARDVLLNTPARQKAWKLLPDNQPLTFTSAFEAVTDAMHSRSTFSHWWKELQRLGLLVPGRGGCTKVALAIPAGPNLVPVEVEGTAAVVQ